MMKIFKSVCGLLFSALFVITTFFVNAPIVKAEGEVPGQVTNLHVTEYPSALHFEWDPVDGASYYHILLYDEDGNLFDLDYISTNGCNFWYWNWQYQPEKMIRVAAVNDFGEGAPSEPCTGYITGPPESMSDITNFRVVSTQSGPNEENRSDLITFGYDFPLETLDFYMEYSTNPDMSGSVRIDLEPGVGCGGCTYSESVYTEHTFDFFSPETTYYFQAHSRYYIVRADPMDGIFDDVYIETVSDIIEFTTNAPASAPDPESCLSFSYVDAGAYYIDVNAETMVRWEDYSRVKVYYSTSPDNLLTESCNVVDLPIIADEYIVFHITGLASSTTYYLQAVGYNSIGVGGPSEMLEVTTTEPQGISTDEGTGVNISDPVSGTSLSFENVTSSGVTTVEQLESPPDDTYFYLEESCGYFDIETTASFDGAVSITLPYDPSLITSPEEDLRIYQFKDGEPIDITDSVDTENNTITGIVADHFCAFAIGIPVRYSVTFDSQGGSYVNSITVNYNTTISEPAAPTKTGYVFAGWYKDDGYTDGWDFAFEKVTSDTTLYAKWLYDFSGFFQPIDMDGVLNVVKAGRSIPIKFSLGGDMGLNVFEDGYPKVYNYFEFSGQTEDTIETIAFSNSGLTYDPVTSQYTYVWKTDKAWSGTCKLLLIRFRDGTVKVIYFKFK